MNIITESEAYYEIKAENSEEKLVIKDMACL